MTEFKTGRTPNPWGGFFEFGVADDDRVTIALEHGCISMRGVLYLDELDELLKRVGLTVRRTDSSPYKLSGHGVIVTSAGPERAA